MAQAIKLSYGTAQPFLSGKMQNHPVLAKWLNRILGYTNIGNYARSRVFRKHISVLALDKMNNILDLGCGYGEYSYMMAKGLPHVNITALDVDPDALKNVRFAQSKLQLNNLTIHEGYIESLPKEEFDLIYSVDVFEHIPEDKMPFAEAYKKLKPGGYLMVKMPNITQSSVFPAAWFEEHEAWLKHEHPGQIYSLEALKNRFTKEGFNIIFASQTDGILSRLSWEIAYLMKKRGSLFQLLSLPFCKGLISLDMLLNKGNSKKGNAITVIGQKLK